MAGSTDTRADSDRADAYFIGLISGTSMDAVDAVLVRIDNAGQPTLLHSHSEAYPQAIRDTILPALQQPEGIEYGRIIQIELALADLFAQAVAALLRQSAVRPDQITAIGNHGQTLCHRPDAATPYTVQLCDNARLAVLTGIDVIGDFRRADMADGGQGAPLAPLIHHALFSQAKQRIGVMNIGGIANLTVLPSTRGTEPAIIGFDTGPGNGLMDSWYQRHQGGRFDADGQWANQGQVRTELLQQLLHDDYFSRPAPKSTGREYFNLHWLATQSALSETLAAVDVQATLLELTAQTTIKAAQQYRCEALFVCGGGAHNPCLLQRMRQLAPELEVQSTAVLGLAPDWVEAVLFAWLAWCYRHQQAVPLPSITGGQHSRIIGAHWHA